MEYIFVKVDYRYLIISTKDIKNKRIKFEIILN